MDIALWDLRCRRARAPLHLVAGGAQLRVPIYNTEGGWLNFTTEELVDRAIEAREAGFRGFKDKVGRPHVAEDVRAWPLCAASSDRTFEIMIDANQCFTVSEAIRSANSFKEFDLAWFEEPMPAEDINGHVRLSQSTSLPIAGIGRRSKACESDTPLFRRRNTPIGFPASGGKYAHPL